MILIILVGMRRPILTVAVVIPQAGTLGFMWREQAEHWHACVFLLLPDGK